MTARTHAHTHPSDPATLHSGLWLGRWFGVEVRADFSLLIIFALIVVNLGAGVFPTWHPDWPLWLVWGVALVAAVLFFGSVLVHELSHALMGRAQGISVPRITLFLFGGMAHMEGKPRSPKAEFWMAIVAPLTSIGIGFAASLLGFILAAPVFPGTDFRQLFPRLGAMTTLLLWLGPINFALGVFNMIPGFPLDGGRVLRAVLWGATGDLAKATRWAAGLGRFIAWLLMGFGALHVFGGALLQGIWLLLIGWFLNNAARASQQQVVVLQALADVPVTRVMRTALARVPPDTSVESAVRDILLASDQESIPIEADGKWIGLVSLADIRKLPQERWPEVTVSEVMTSAEQMPTLPPDAVAEQALERLGDSRTDQIPIVDRGTMVGVVSGRDLAKWLSLRGVASS